MYKKHQGIWFCIYMIEVMFWVALLLSIIGAADWIARSVLLFLGSIMFYGVVYFHGKWIESKFRKESANGQKRNQ